MLLDHSYLYKNISSLYFLEDQEQKERNEQLVLAIYSGAQVLMPQKFKSGNKSKVLEF